MLNISREYSHNSNTAAFLFFVVVCFVFFSRCSPGAPQLQLEWILHGEWDLGAVPFGVLFCRLPICHKSSLLCSWSLRPCLLPPGGNTIRCRGHFIQCHCLSTAVIRKKMLEPPQWRKHWTLGKYKKQDKKSERRRTTEQQRCTQRKGKSPELLSEGKQAQPLMSDNIEQNMYWRQRLCLLPVPFGWTTPLHPLPPAF